MADEEQKDATQTDATTTIIDADAGKQMIRNKRGQFVKGTNCGGRAKGAFTGVHAFREMFNKHIDEMCATGAEFDQLLTEMRKTKGGVWRIFKLGLQAMRDENRAKSRDPDGGGVNAGRSVRVVMIEEKPPEPKHVESRVLNPVESGGNGKAS